MGTRDKSVFQSFLCHMTFHNQSELGIWVRNIQRGVELENKYVVFLAAMSSSRSDDVTQ